MTNTSLHLGYWNIRGLAQPIRYLLEYAGAQYTEKRYELGPAPELSRDAWLQEKQKLGLDFPNLPYLCDGDLRLTQSNAIIEYLAKKYGLAGTSLKDEARCVMLLHEAYDLRNAIVRLCYSSKESYKTKLPQFLETTLSHYLDVFSRFLGANEFLLGSISAADFVVYELFDQCRTMKPGCLDTHKSIIAFLDRFESQPAIAAYRSSDRFISRPINNLSAAFH